MYPRVVLMVHVLFMLSSRGTIADDPCLSLSFVCIM